jgi:REP element-mobilizing transposase RayT
MKSKFDPQKHHRRSICLPGYDYSSEGAYYVTIVTYHRDCLFGEIVDKEMILNDLGKIADECWRVIPEHFPFVELGAYVIMPNHVHGIIVIRADVSLLTTAVIDDRRGTIYRAPTQEQFQKPVAGSIPTIIRTYKAAVTRRIGREHNAAGIWQRNYGACPELVEGNTSSVMIRICKTNPITSMPTQCCGMTTMKIHRAMTSKI